MRRRRPSVAAGTTPWLITLADLMTLLLTFFIILVSLSVFDESARQRVAESVSRVFSMPDSSFFPFTFKTEEEQADLPPPARHDDSLLRLRRIMGVAGDRAVSLSRNNRVAVITIDNDLLFPPARTGLTERGSEILAALAPYLAAGEHPLRLAAHSAPGLESDDLPLAGLAGQIGEGGDLGRALALERAQTVYEFLIRRGLDPARLSLEAHGAGRPRFSNPDGYANPLNRRLEIVVDRRDLAFVGGSPAGAGAEEPDPRLRFPEPALPESGPDGVDGTGEAVGLVSPYSGGGR